MNDPSINWDTRNGEVVVSPLTQYATAIFAKVFCGLRLEYLPEGSKPQAVQLILTVEQTEALRDAMTRQLDAIRAPDPTATKQ